MERQEAVCEQETERIVVVRSVAQPLWVNYRRPLSELKRLGAYDWTNAHVTEQFFRMEDHGLVEYEAALFEFGADYDPRVARAEVLAYEPARPWRLAGVWPLLEYGRQSPYQQRSFPIAGLGARANVSGDEYFPYLHKMGEVKRAVYLQAASLKVYRHMRLLALRRV